MQQCAAGIPLILRRILTSFNVLLILSQAIVTDVEKNNKSFDMAYYIQLNGAFTLFISRINS